MGIGSVGKILTMAPLSGSIKNKVEIIGPFQEFFKKIVNGSLLLSIAAIVAIIWANVSASYGSFWATELSLNIGDMHISKSLVHWIDEALMTLFFFTVGLEIKREVIVGELSSLKKALLPVSAAIGGMVFPAVIYAAFNYNTDTANGWGIPMATDIAFSLAILAVLGKRVPLGTRIFLTAFAIADDLGAVVIISIFYTKAISWGFLLGALFLLCSIAIANYLWIRHTLVYALLGIGVWICVLYSGVHATVAGVLVAFLIPSKGKDDTQTFIDKVNSYINDFQCQGECGHTILLNKNHQNAVQSIEIACHEVETPLRRLEYALNPWVAFLILPLFALANSGITLGNIDVAGSVTHPVMLGIMFGLVLGKPIGIIFFTYLSVKILKTDLQQGVRWIHIIGASFLGGIGFTMSLFISGLSFVDHEIIELAKFSIVLSSIISAIAGLGFLWYGYLNEKKL
ncbi:MAG: Na+/H+ antiporter NhaA [Desulfobacteraceae bacterium]|nr:Na+/H+ antiporter NhaA [Desulfobacteraceae bacterium]